MDDPEVDRFPSTAPAKTTVADIEIIQAMGGFEAAVTFFTEFQTQANVEECIVDAALAAHEGASIDKIADRFLNHRDQRFRLSYILGSWKLQSNGIEDDEFSFDENEPESVQDDLAYSAAEREIDRQVLVEFVERVTGLAGSTLRRLSKDLDLSAAKLAGPDREAAEKLIEESFEHYLTQDEQFHELVQDVLDAIRSRLDLIAFGELRRTRSGWPQIWLYQTGDRTEFITQIRWFSSNYWPEFGRLLTPLVEGIRVKGPLQPLFSTELPKLVLIDGQGLTSLLLVVWKDCYLPVQMKICLLPSNSENCKKIDVYSMWGSPVLKLTYLPKLDTWL